MFRRFDDLWDTSATDGASTPIGLFTDNSERQELMDAWLKERRECIEYGLYLDQACQLLKRILAEEGVTRESRRRARHLIRAIKEAKDAPHDDTA